VRAAALVEAIVSARVDIDDERTPHRRTAQPRSDTS
jgi:hypothetical protein